ncbi:LOW QUALITY PROTEIN: H/ACA ribonucleoprotein complex subunit 1 [Saitozyma sp. JCM 24511]|nr:LOW QUALITY PROTEIN: H/ACA ribonucleoprotein complex subunit 1 [Saitozyma sp. JCM 24511]
MSGRGGYSRGGGGDRGRGGFRGGSRGGRGGFGQRDFGPPDTVLEIGSFLHPVESEMLCSLTAPTKIPYFNAPIYLSNKTQIGKVDEILGPINEVYFTVKMEQGMQASSFKKEDKVYIGGDKLLPIERFLPKPKVPGGEKIPRRHFTLSSEEVRLAVGAHHEVAEVQGVVDEAHPAAVVGAVSAVIAVDEAADVLEGWVVKGWWFLPWER